MRKIKKNQLSILLTSILLGVLIIVQSRSFQDIGDVLSRNSRSDIFRELTILKKTNASLVDEVTDLESQLSKLSNNQEALSVIREEVKKYETLTGRISVSGPGIHMEIDGNVRAIWLTDIVNELFSAGAEAVSVNGIRLTDRTIGFDTIPSGQIVLNGSLLKYPYLFEAIGDRDVLEKALIQPQGILERLTQNVAGVSYTLAQKDLVTLEKAL